MYSLRAVLLLLSAIPAIRAATESTPALKPCTIHSPSTGSFIDLRPLQLSLGGSKTQPATNASYHSRGYDYPYNFTLNFCGPVVEELADVGGLSKSKWANVSAFYTDDNNVSHSLGQENHDLVYRGRKLVLNYTGGSPCPDFDEDGRPILVRDLEARKQIDNDDDDDEDDHKKKPKAVIRRKNTLLSFTCDTNPTVSTRPAVSFVGTSDHCTYVFEVRSRYACGGTTASGDKGTLGPGGVFTVILAIAFLVYLVGGIVYRRNVMHQRGWRQIPNYEVWASIFGFFSDMVIILFSSCTQCMPFLGRLSGGRRGGYHRVGTDDVRTSRGRGRDPEAENRLIDSYDEEWEN